MAESKLVLDDLHKAYPGPLPVLDGVSFDVAPGEFVSVIGPSGCGKSTLFNVIAGLERAVADCTELLGPDHPDTRALRADLADVHSPQGHSPQRLGLSA